MANTFDIRFAKSAGLAALFEAPANRFRWKGAGRISIDAQGVSIAVRRGFMNLFSRRRSHRISPGEFTEVYREGDALRLEFSNADVREVLPIWATGSDTAAQIVKLLPTSRTVELEGDTPPAATYRFDRPVVAWLLGCAAALALGSWALQRMLAPPVATIPEALTGPDVEFSPARDAAPPAPAQPAATPVQAPALVQPIARGSRAYAAARNHVALFEAELDERLREYLGWLESPAPVDLVRLERRWRQMVERIQGNMDYQGPELWMLRDAQLEICRNWQQFLLLFAAGLRAHDSDLTSLAFSLRRDADARAEWLRWYVPL